LQSDDIVVELIESTSNTKNLTRLYEYAEKDWVKSEIIKKVTSDSFINEIVKQENIDSPIYPIALAKLNNPLIIKFLLYKHRNENKFKEILLWRCSDKNILEKIEIFDSNDTLSLIAKTRKEIIDSDNQNFMRNFFKRWHSKVTPANDKEIQKMPAEEKDVYELYNLFLSEKYKTNPKSKYIVLPLTMKYRIDSTATGNSDPEKFNHNAPYGKVIENFRPYTSNLDGKTLYLDGLYSKVIEGYIRYCQIDSQVLKYHKKGNEIAGLNQQDTDYKVRMKLLNKFIPAFEGHWGGYYILISHPVITSITFAKDRTMASLAYTAGYGGSSDFYVKKSGKWVFSHRSQSQWIE
jgi:hypothetical protein